jgi:hypothetical protein
MASQLVIIIIIESRPGFLPLSAAGKLVTVKTFKTGLQTIFIWTGKVSVNDYLSYSPQSILLTGNSPAQAIVRISVPESVSDQMLNQTIKIMASFDVDDFPSTWL